jgi:glutamate/tyrosine decarboxylase-like PLP-dependent enzyme
MANMVGLFAARAAATAGAVRTQGVDGVTRDGGRLRVYTSAETHTWIQKAADLFGLGTDAIRWIATDGELRMDADVLRRQLGEDREAGDLPFLIIGTAGSVGTGAVDPLPELAAICRELGVWFHVDGAYGALAALVRRGAQLRDAFSYHPPYYRFGGEEGEAPVNFYEHGPQNSRGFRALKVWLGLAQVGRAGYTRMIADDIQLAREMYRCVEAHPELEAFTQGLSITTFRYVPRDLKDLKPDDAAAEEYLNALNTELLDRLQRGGEVFVSNAIVRGAFVLRACIVNFRTTLADVEALPEIVARAGREVDAELRGSGE